MSLALKNPIKAIQAHAFLGPAAILFVSANIANAANLIFNMIFARLMGPALFADLTLLLTLKLGVLSFLGAFQFAFAEQAAKAKYIPTSKITAFALSWQSLKISVPIMFVIIVSARAISSWLNFTSPNALVLLAIAIPFFLPMVIYRGLTQGLIHVPKIVLSIQAEWIIRLIGSILLWQMGFGLTGIAAAVGLSIAIGFIVSTDRQDWASRKAALSAQTTTNVKALSLIAMPYLILQLAQILVLDSDILIAKAVFSTETAGLVAGLLLIQRIFFFAFLSGSIILQPFIAQQSGESAGPKELFILLMAIAFISAAALVVITPNSGLIVKLMLGEAYTQLSSIVWISALTGAVFIVSHLCAIYQIAKEQKLAVQIVLGFGLAQLIVLASVNHIFEGIDLHSYFMIKLVVQIVCALCLLGLVMRGARRAKKRVIK
ncbi:MAG: hypothetical protein ABJG88_09860 [Litorimonas sp.]